MDSGLDSSPARSFNNLGVIVSRARSHSGNWPNKILGPIDSVNPKFPLPGAVALYFASKVFKVPLTPAAVIIPKPACERYASILSEVQSVLENEVPATVPVIPSLKTDLLEVKVYACPTILKKDLDLFFPRRDFSRTDLAVITLSRRAQPEASRSPEGHNFVEQFVEAAIDISGSLKEMGYWADFIDPRTGKPDCGYKEIKADNFEHAMLVQQLIVGLRDEKARENLLSEKKDLSWEKACDIASHQERVRQNLQQLNQSNDRVIASLESEMAVSLVNTAVSSPKQRPSAPSKQLPSCYRCGQHHVRWSDCRHQKTFSPHLVAGSWQFPRVGEIELVAFLQRRDEYENFRIFGTNWQGMDTRTVSSAAASARTHGKQTEESRQHWHPLPYIKNVSEATERIAGELGVGIARRPTATMRNKIMRVKDRLVVGEQSGVVYQIPCQDCPRHYTGQTERRLSSRIMKRKLAVQRGDPLSQVVTHTLEEGHEFNFASTRMIARASNKTGRELLEAWLSDTKSINRHVDVPSCYHALRSRGQEARPNFQPRVHAVTSP
nr:unnamed protein product [Spirometra erinaceieuropaei]